MRCQCDVLSKTTREVYTSTMVRSRSHKRALVISGIIGVIIICVLAYLYASFKKGAAEMKTEQQKQFTIGGFRTLINQPSSVVPDPAISGYMMFTSYRLGVRFSYKKFYDGGYQQKCPLAAEYCPHVPEKNVIGQPEEKDNTIKFLGYTLYVFEKDPAEDFPTAVTRVAASGNAACPVLVYPESSDKVVKAAITNSSSCTSDYIYNNDGGHFFMYPKYANVFFFVRGPANTAALFDHTHTWIDAILIKG